MPPQQGSNEAKNEADAGPDIADAMVMDLEPGRRYGCGEYKRLYEGTSNSGHHRHNGQNRHFDTDLILPSAPLDRIAEPIELTGGCRLHHQFCAASGSSRRAAHPAAARRIA